MAVATSAIGTEQGPAGPAGDLAPVFDLPSQSEEGFFYPALTAPVETRIIEAVGHVAGSGREVGLTIETPADEADLTDNVPLLIFHGLCGVESAYDEFRSQIAQRGKPAVTWQPARHRSVVADMNLLNDLHPQKLASQAALGVTRTVEAETGQTVFDAWAHSNGGQTVAELSLHKPELIRSIVMASVVGLDEHNLVKMIGRLGKFARHDLLPSLGRLASKPEFLMEEAIYMGSNPALTLAEAVSAGSCSLHERLQQVRESGVPVGAIQYAQDDFHPLNEVARHSSEMVDIFHVYRDPSARHTSPQTHPSDNAEAYLEVAGQLELQPSLFVVS